MPPDFPDAHFLRSNHLFDPIFQFSQAPAEPQALCSADFLPQWAVGPLFAKSPNDFPRPLLKLSLASARAVQRSSNSGSESSDQLQLYRDAHAAKRDDEQNRPGDTNMQKTRSATLWKRLESILGDLRVALERLTASVKRLRVELPQISPNRTKLPRSDFFGIFHPFDTIFDDLPSMFRRFFLRSWCACGITSKMHASHARLACEHVRALHVSRRPQSLLFDLASMRTLQVHLVGISMYVICIIWEKHKNVYEKQHAKVGQKQQEDKTAVCFFLAFVIFFCHCFFSPICLAELNCF